MRRNLMITIRHAANGFIVEHDEEMHPSVYGDTVEDMQEMLYDILTFVGHTGSRHDAKRIYIRVEPGDKYEPVVSINDEWPIEGDIPEET
jgi:hypothetical protein